MHILNNFGTCNSVLAANFLSQSQRKDAWYESKLESPTPIFDKNKTYKSTSEPLLPTDESTSHSPTSAKSFSDSQLETFNYQHGVFILHLFATLLFVPSLVAWLQVSLSLSLSISPDHTDQVVKRLHILSSFFYIKELLNFLNF